MERHLMAVCVFCLLCVDHLTCQQHINDDLLLFPVKIHEQLMHNTHNTKNNQLHNHNHIQNKRSNNNNNNNNNEEEEEENIKFHHTEEQLNMKAFDEHSIKLLQQHNTNTNTFINFYKNLNKKDTATTDKSIGKTIYLPNNNINNSNNLNERNPIEEIEEQQLTQQEHRINIKLPKYNKHYDNNNDIISSKEGISEKVDISKIRDHSRKRLKRHANHNNDEYEHEKSLLSSSLAAAATTTTKTTLLRMPKITQEYLKNFFIEYGSNNDNATITLKNFQKLLHQLGLTEMLLHVHNLNNITTETTTITKQLLINNNNKTSSNFAENNTCISETSLLQLVQKKHNESEHQHQHEQINYALNREDVLNICPVLLYQLASPIQSIRGGCIKQEQIEAMQLEEHEEDVLRLTKNKKTLMIVWVYAFISVLACSILGLVGVAIIPFMDSRYYQHIIHFLVALAVGTMTGDALLHLLPHSLSNQSEKQMIYKGLVCMSGILFFYITEHGLTMISEWRKSKVKNDMKKNNTKWQMAKVMRDTSGDATTTTTTRHTTCAPIIGNNGGNVVASTVNDKVCKSKYSSYPYCYDEIAMDMLNDVWLHLPKNVNNSTTTTVTTTTTTTTTTTPTNDITNTTAAATAAGVGVGVASEISNSDGDNIDINIGKFERRRNGKKLQNTNDSVEMSAVQSLLTEQQQQQNHCPHNHHHNKNSNNQQQQQQYHNYKHHVNNLKEEYDGEDKEEEEQNADLEGNIIDIEAGGDGLIKKNTVKPNGHNACNCNCKSCDVPADNETTLNTHHINDDRIASIGGRDVAATAHRDNEPITVILREHEATHHGHSHKHGHVHSPPETLSAVAWMIIMGDGLHNFTDGMAIGAAFAESIAGGFSTALAVFCHELPHELGDFAILMKAGMSVKSAVFYNLLTGVLSFIGMIFGIVFGQTQETAQWMFAAAAGLFIYIALVDMMPEISAAHKSIYEFILQILGISSGVALMLVIAIYEDDLMNVFPSQ